jgi:hypothetical protein
MRARLILAIAAGALGFGFSQPAVAGGWGDDYCCAGGRTYVHHHVYYPPRYRHIYYVHKPGPRHVHVVHGGEVCCGPRHYGYRYSGYFARPYFYRWQWRGGRRHW